MKASDNPNYIKNGYRKVYPKAVALYKNILEKIVNLQSIDRKI